GDYLLYEVETKGIKKSDGEDIRNLIVQKPNTRIPLTNFSVGVFIYNIGLTTYDSTKLAQRKSSLEEEKQLLELNLNQDPDQRKLEKRYTTVNSDLATIEKKLNYGNWFMRTGNPVILYDSSKTVESQIQIDSYLANHGFFDASVSVEVEKKKNKAFVTYLITEREPYLIDSIFHKTEDDHLLEILHANPGSLVKRGEIYNQAALTQERQRLEDLLRNRGYYNFSKSYIEFNVYKDTVEHAVGIEKLVREPAISGSHEVYTINTIDFIIDSPSDVIQNQEVKNTY